MIDDKGLMELLALATKLGISIEALCQLIEE